MNYRYIILNARSGAGSGFGKEFDNRFDYNTWFISNYFSMQIRKLHIPSDGPYNMLFCQITREQSSIKECSVSCLHINLHVEDDEIHKYLNMTKETDRFEYYLSLLERGYRLAIERGRDIPIEVLLKLHQEFRDNAYRNERLFKKKRLMDYGIKIELNHVLTSYSYNLVLAIHDLHDNLIGKGSIYETYPDDIFFNKNVRHLVFEDGKMIVTDFLDHPQFVCKLEDMSKGIIHSVCVNERTQMYIPNENNLAKFEELKW